MCAIKFRSELIGGSMSRGVIEKYIVNFESTDFKRNIKFYFEMFGCTDIYDHTLDVVKETHKLSKYLKFDMQKCEMASYMHDLGRIVKREDMVQLCVESGHKFISGEEKVPSILHQVASRVIANKVFGIEDFQILDALECHTTLKANPSEVDMIVFLSDKLSWKEEEHSGLVSSMREKSIDSKEEAILEYLKSVHEHRYELKCYHQWTEDAFNFFNRK